MEEDTRDSRFKSEGFWHKSLCHKDLGPLSQATEPFDKLSVCEAMNMEPIHQLTQLTPFAYLDGGSGSLMVQMLIASSVTAAYAAKTRWANLVAAIAKFRHRNTKTSGQ